MLNPPSAAFLLAVEAQRLIELRPVRIASGGTEAHAEMVSMVSGKVVAAMEAATTLMTGGMHDQVVAGYRESVAANTWRLTA